MTQSDVNQIHIPTILQSKMGDKARYVPHFVVRLLERLIHVDYINSYLRKGYVGVPFCQGVLDQLGVAVHVKGLDNLSLQNPDGSPTRYTFVSNHPLGAIDGVTLGAIIGRHYDGRVKYLVNDLLMNLKGLAPLCIPVNVAGRTQDRHFPQLVDSAFQSDNHILMFPARLCSRQIDGQIQDLPWNKAFIRKSIETHRDIVPVHFIGQNSPRFYRIANLCKKLHLKVNLAMLLLPDEMYRSRGGQYTVCFGRPIPWQTFDQSRTPLQWAQWVRQQAYTLH